MNCKHFIIGATLLFSVPATAQIYSPSHEFPAAGNMNTGIGQGNNDPTHALDVDGELRVRTIDQDNSLTRILAIDNDGVLHWRDNATIGGADNDWAINNITGNMFNLNPGNVGVGINNPTNLFHVQNGAATQGSRIGIGSIEWIQDDANSIRIGCDFALNSFHPNVDCETDLGRSNLRFDRLFLCTGIFQAVDGGLIGGKSNSTVIPSSESLSYIRTLNIFDTGGNIQLDPTKVSAFLPEAVDDPSKRFEYGENGEAIPAEGPISINMTALTPHMIGAIREVDNQLQECCLANSKASEEVDRLNEQVERLEEELNELKTLLTEMLPEKDRAKLNGARLMQNTPNPFNSKTKIGYFIPSDAQEASIVINTADGSQVEVIELTNRGEGSQDVETSGWNNSGVYYYSLIVDGELISTHKMVLNK